MVRLVLGNGEHVGIVPRDEAISRAKESGKDLVEIAPNAEPPVCKILDYGKFKYREEKKRQKQRKKHKTELKEIRIGMRTEEHDLNFKADRVREFIKDHNKVLIALHLTGREKGQNERAMEIINEYSKRFTDIAKIEKEPVRENAGRISMILSPR
jgi:translation initiation factor IF-3